MDSNLTISKINKCRYNLKKYLNEEWNVSHIIDYSDDEIEKLYRSSKPINSKIQFGNSSGCDFSLYHKNIPNHKIHIIHYNFPEIGKPSIKINKTCAEKLKLLYNDKIISSEDSLIIILYNSMTENLEKCNARINQLPIILRKDPIAKRLRLAPGDICKIKRKTKSAGEIDYYRVCK